jgi:hypothetical protein
MAQTFDVASIKRPLGEIDFFGYKGFDLAAAFQMGNENSASSGNRF